MNSNFASYQIGQDEPHPEPARNNGPQVFVRDTITKVSSVDGADTEATQGLQKDTAASLNPHHGTESVLATARHPRGLPFTEITPDLLVTVDGVQASVAFWVSEGRLQKSADGTYVEGAGNAPAVMEDTSDVLPISEQAMGTINAALAEVDQGSLDGLSALGMGVAVGRLDVGTLAHKFGQASGLASEESHARIATITAAFQAQADAALKSRSGIGAEDLPGFYQWAKANHREQLQEAVQKQLHRHDVSGYAALASKWKASVAPSLNAFKAAGIPVRSQGNTPEVFVAGSWMTPSAAARAGLI
jgi:hypothetical protein